MNLSPAYSDMVVNRLRILKHFGEKRNEREDQSDIS